MVAGIKSYAHDKGAGAVAEGRRTAFMAHGVTVKPDATVEQAVKQGGLDYLVEKVEVQTADGRKIPNRFAIRRADTKDVFDVVGTGYHEVQNLDAFGVLDEYRQVLGVEFGACGTQAKGRVAWIQVKLPNTLLADVDPTEMHLIVTTSHDGKRSIAGAITPVRLACLNQMNLAVRQATQRWAIRHTSTAEARLAEAHAAAGFIESYSKAYEAQTLSLTKHKMGVKAMDTFLKSLLPDRPVREKEIAGIKALALESPTCEFGRGTAYAVLQATREYYDHVKPQRTTESAFINATTGVNKKTADRAFRMLLER